MNKIGILLCLIFLSFGCNTDDVDVEQVLMDMLTAIEKYRNNEIAAGTDIAMVWVNNYRYFVSIGKDWDYVFQYRVFTTLTHSKESYLKKEAAYRNRFVSLFGAPSEIEANEYAEDGIITWMVEAKKYTMFDRLKNIEGYNGFLEIIIVSKNYLYDGSKNIDVILIF